jgi:hypothetical protein
MQSLFEKFTKGFTKGLTGSHMCEVDRFFLLVSAGDKELIKLD